jgi:hypothetical protein
MHLACLDFQWLIVLPVPDTIHHAGLRKRTVLIRVNVCTEIVISKYVPKPSQAHESVIYLLHTCGDQP